MIDSVNVELIWEPGAKEKLTEDTPDKIMYEIAAQTLTLTEPTIPYRTGKMHQSTLAKGVQGSNCKYHIGSYTDYAAYVYVMPQSTNWTTPGTNAYWFRETWQKYGNNIIQQSIERNKLR